MDQRFYSFMEFYMINLKIQGVKIQSYFHFKVSILPTRRSYNDRDKVKTSSAQVIQTITPHPCFHDIS